MEVLKERSGFLSNYEVLKLLKENKNQTELDKQNKVKRLNNQRLKILSDQAIQYLENQPCNQLNDEKFSKVMTYLKDYDLVKVEKLQIVNFLPNAVVLLAPFIESISDRFTFNNGEEKENEENEDNQDAMETDISPAEGNQANQQANQQANGRKHYRNNADDLVLDIQRIVEETSVNGLL